MKKRIIALFIPVIMFLLVSQAPAGIWGESVTFDDLSDQRSFSSVNYDPPYSEGGLSGYWPYSFEISWDIEYDINTMLWTYEYTLSASRKDISHFILELSDGLTKDDFWDASINGGSTGNYLEGPGNWGLHKIKGKHPGDPDYPSDSPIYGIKFDRGGGSVTYSFTTSSDPVWGNFYAKGGKDRGNRIYAYNNALAVDGFDSDDPLDFIVRPNGGSSPPVVPEPVSAILFVTGGAVLLYRRYRKDDSQRHQNLT